MIRVHLKISALFVVSHFLSAEMSPELMEVKTNPGFRTQKTCSFLSNQGVPSTEITDTKIIWTFSRDQILCALNWGVLWIEMPQRRCSTVFALCQRICWFPTFITFYIEANYWQEVSYSQRERFFKTSYTNHRVYNSRKTEWSPIRSVIIRVINNAGVRFVQSWENDYRPNWTTNVLSN